MMIHEIAVQIKTTLWKKNKNKLIANEISKWRLSKLIQFIFINFTTDFHYFYSYFFLGCIVTLMLGTQTKTHLSTLI